MPRLPREAALALLCVLAACARSTSSQVAPPAATSAPRPDIPPPFSAAPEQEPTFAADPCPPDRDGEREQIVEPGGRRRVYSVDGYEGRWLRLTRTIDRVERSHCVLVAWPAGRENNDARPVHVAGVVHDGWFRALRNTLLRVPWQHTELVRRIVIDNRPTEHGVAPFDRRSPDDARDGHTIWLHEHLFKDENHWARGNHGSYWSYHVSEDERTFHQAGAEHDLFSPVLLHELGHLVMYHVINHPLEGIQATAAPECARTCGDAGSCGKLSALERERGCITPYCQPFRFETGTENWAEQYRFFYQSSGTRALLGEASAGCLSLLGKLDGGSGPWAAGLPDISRFRPSLWNSCGSKPCKRW
jgi:hypothetical protein